jgi:AcrR family transcriptional regulator
VPIERSIGSLVEGIGLSERAEVPTQRQIYEAAVRLMYELGYHGTSTRAIAREVGIESSSLYYHYPSKQDILVDIMTRNMRQLIADVEVAVDGLPNATERLRAAIIAHVRFECAGRMQSFVTDSEIRALEPDNRQAIINLRDQYEQIFQRILEEGVATARFAIPDIRLTVLALMAICTGVSTWYQPDGRLGPEEIAKRYADLVVDGVLRHESSAGELQ